MKLTPEVKAKLSATVRAFLAAHERDMASENYAGLDAQQAKRKFLEAVERESKLWAAIPSVLRTQLDRKGPHGIYETLRMGCPEEIKRIYMKAGSDPEYMHRTKIFWQYLRPRGGEDFISEDDEENDGPDPIMDEDVYEAGGPKYAAAAVEGVEPVHDVIPSETRGQVYKSTIPHGEGTILPREEVWLPNETTGERSEFIMPENEGAPMPRVENVEDDVLEEGSDDIEDDEHLV